MKTPTRNLLATALCISLFSAGNSAQAAYTFVIDNFSVTRDGLAFFNDAFSDGTPPPSAPNFANGTSATYTVTSATGTMGPETGGKLAIDSTAGMPNPLGFANYSQTAVLNTNTSTALADNSKGLKSGYTFSVLGLFNLVQPGPVGETYGIRLSDLTAASNGVDTFNLGIRRFADNNLYVELRQVDFTGVSSTVLQAIALNSAHDQIQLALERSSLSSNALTASFAYVDGGVVGAANTFSATPTIFNGGNFTRAGFYATTPVPLPAAAWLLGSGLVALIGVARKRKAV